MMRFFKRKKTDDTTPQGAEVTVAASEEVLAQEAVQEEVVEAIEASVVVEEPVAAEAAVIPTIPAAEVFVEKAAEKPAEKPIVAEKKNWAVRLKEGLSRTSGQISEGISSIFTKRKLDDEALEELEELLIRADLGAKVATRVVSEFSQGKFDREIAPEEVKEELANRIAAILEPSAKQVDIQKSQRPHVMLVVGVNGNGKTTTIGKMAHLLKNSGWSVMMAAADTFRAAAVSQLQVWGDRVGCTVVTGVENADPASVVYRAYEDAVAAGADVLLVDTAGRLHNKQNLMAELHKIFKVLQKLNPDAPHSVVQVLDATTGQNALAQVEAFKSMANVSGLIVTKLDGTAKGGVVVALAEKFGLPIHAIGVGEGIDDLRNFSAQDFARNLLG